MPVPKLPISNMADRHYALTPAQAECWLEAARVCLDRHHISPQDFELRDGTENSPVYVEWECATDRMRASQNNDDDATRDGAYLIVLAAAELSKGLVAVKRAETRTGADYYVAPIGIEVEDLENCLRLEVSGNSKGDVSEVNRRLNSKVRQAKDGDSNLPALAGVVGFSAKLIAIKRVESKSDLV